MPIFLQMSIGGNVVYSEVSDSNGNVPVADVACDVDVSIQISRTGYVETTTVSVEYHQRLYSEGCAQGLSCNISLILF